MDLADSLRRKYAKNKIVLTNKEISIIFKVTTYKTSHGMDFFIILKTSELIVIINIIIINIIIILLQYYIISLLK